jgi:4-phytase / acid phosphatase
MRKSSVIRLLLVCLVTGLLFFACAGNEGSSSGEKSDQTDLVSVVAISRHGIRSQTISMEDMNLLTLRAQGYPLWPAPADDPGNLTTHGQENATRLGVWYRDFYAAQGLLPPKGSCPAAGGVYVYADNLERTIHTAQGYLDGLFQSEPTSNDCGVQVIYSTEKFDPFIATLPAGVCQVDSAVDLAAFNARTGNDPDSLKTAYATQLQTMQTVTQCCQPAACATKENPTPASCSLLDLPSEVSVNSTTGAVQFGLLFGVAEMIAEQFQLEYTQGMLETDCATTQGAECVGWGEIPPGGLDDMMKLHVMYFDLISRLPSYAQASASNLVWQLVGTMDQTISGVRNADVLAPVQSKFTLFVGHDDLNISAIGGFLGVHWQAESFQPDDPDQAGALVFELHRARQNGQLIVRLFFVTATLDQMRNGTDLTLETPPQRIPLLVPACGGGLDCPYDQFKAFVTGHVRQDCLVTAASAP